MKKAVFLSHSSHDREEAELIYQRLLKCGVDAWASFRDIPPGAEWDKSIQAALDDARFVLIVVSHSSVESSYVRTEVEFALNEGKTVIPILIENVKLPLRWHTLQFVDYT